MRILGIESSCDETAVAIYDSEVGLLGHEIFSQIDTHRVYGGVVPELAARDHIAKCLPLIDHLLISTQLSHSDIDAIAYTKGPGLIGALLVGAAMACSLAYAWSKPVIGVHHLEAHIMAAMLEPQPPSYPFMCLLVSGGHSQIFWVEKPHSYQLVGESLDDAAGEAFDKTAKLLGLGYPGGPALAACAKHGDAQSYSLPRPMCDRPGCDMSFSGIKTHMMRLVQQQPQPLDQQMKANLAASFENAIVDTLRIKIQRACDLYQASSLVVVGGVSANQRLRQVFRDVFTSRGIEVFYPRAEFSTDNAAMVAYTGYLHMQVDSGCVERGCPEIKVKPRWPLADFLMV